MPFRLWVEQALDDPSLQTLFYGPVNLVGRNSATSYLEFGLYRNAALSGDLLPPPCSTRWGPGRRSAARVRWSRGYGRRWTRA